MNDLNVFSRLKIIFPAFAMMIGGYLALLGFIKPQNLESYVRTPEGCKDRVENIVRQMNKDMAYRDSCGLHAVMGSLKPQELANEFTRYADPQDRQLKQLSDICWVQKDFDSVYHRHLEEMKDPEKAKTFYDFVAQIKRNYDDLRTDPRGNLTLFNHVINNMVVFEYDSVAHHQKDYWQTPYETLTLMHGDCEDAALLKYFVSRAMGILSVDCFLVSWDGHVNFGVNAEKSTRKNPAIYILDNGYYEQDAVLLSEYNSNHMLHPYTIFNEDLVQPLCVTVKTSYGAQSERRLSSLSPPGNHRN